MKHKFDCPTCLVGADKCKVRADYRKMKESHFYKFINDKNIKLPCIFRTEMGYAIVRNGNLKMETEWIDEFVDAR